MLHILFIISLRNLNSNRFFDLYNLTLPIFASIKLSIDIFLHDFVNLENYIFGILSGFNNKCKTRKSVYGTHM